jgi:hypothetical protein
MYLIVANNTTAPGDVHRQANGALTEHALMKRTKVQWRRVSIKAICKTEVCCYQQGRSVVIMGIIRNGTVLDATTDDM